MRNKLLTVPVLAAALALAGCSGDSEPDISAVPEQSTAATTTAPTAPETATSGTPLEPSAPTSTPAGGTASEGAATDLYTKTFPLTWEDALQQARASFDGDVSKIELEADDTGRYHYKIELLSDTQEYERQIDAVSGESLSESTEDLDSEDIQTERQQEGIDLAGVVTLKDAMDAARAVQPGPINAWKLEGRDTGARYEFDIDKGPGGGGDYEVQVDAASGKVTNTGT